MARKKRQRAARPARQREERAQDPRLVATQVAQDNAELGIKASDWIVAVSPVRLPDGRILAYHPPQPVTFNLVEAKRHRDRGARQRRSIMGNLEVDRNGQYRPLNSHSVIDCLSDLVGAVLHAFTAIESLANHSIDQLDDDAAVEVERQGATVMIHKDAMVRRLNITEKLQLALPLLEDGPEWLAEPNLIAATAASPLDVIYPPVFAAASPLLPLRDPASVALGYVERPAPPG